MEPILGSTPRSFGYPLTVVLPWRARGRLRATLSSQFTAALLSAALLWPWQPALAQFTQDSPPLVGNDVDGPGSLQGSSVALSGDGSTVIVGGSATSIIAGSAWVFTRGPLGWSQQGA
jgi:hypothetical protein